MANAPDTSPGTAAVGAGNGGTNGTAPGQLDTNAAGAPQPGTLPSMRILGQYLKDLSFENPNAPQSLGNQQGQPTSTSRSM